MKTNTLAKFVHLSDMHFGLVGRENINKVMATLFPGAQGHDPRACNYLERFMRENPAAEDAGLIFTGDLTCWGHENQFELARNFFSKPPRRDDSGFHSVRGLNKKNWDELAISGNHDQWPGKPTIWGAPTPGLAETFPSHPFIKSRQLEDNTLLTFLGIDTDADVSHFGLKRILARGSFRSQLRALSQRLKPPSDNEIRVLLLHHSSVHDECRCRIDKKSQKELESFINENNISVLLTGHIHTPLISVYDQGKEDKVLESRCGTTSLKYNTSPEWSNNSKLSSTFLERKQARGILSDTHTLMIHEIEKQNDSIYWSSRTYFLFLDDGFISISKLNSELAKRGSSELDANSLGLSGRIKVWPRQNQQVASE